MSEQDKEQKTGPDEKSPGASHTDKIKVTGGSAEQGEGELNPSAPGNTGTTPGTNAKVG